MSKTLKRIEGRYAAVGDHRDEPVPRVLPHGFQPPAVVRNDRGAKRVALDHLDGRLLAGFTMHAPKPLDPAALAQSIERSELAGEAARRGGVMVELGRSGGAVIVR